MATLAPIYPITVAGQKLKLQFISSDSPTKLGVNMQFVMEQDMEDIRDKQELSNKISIALQKKFGDAGVAVAFNDRNPYKNVISFIVPMDSISKLLIDILKG
jgi:hypothetical protein